MAVCTPQPPVEREPILACRECYETFFPVAPSTFILGCAVVLKSLATWQYVPGALIILFPFCPNQLPFFLIPTLLLAEPLSFSPGKDVHAF